MYARIVCTDTTVMHVWPGYCETWVKGQGPVRAAATADQVETAHRLGYRGNIERMVLEHEAAHTWLASQLSDGPSPVMEHLAGVREVPLDERQHEEALVLAFQAHINAAPHTMMAKAFRSWIHGQGHGGISQP